jgi:hypothetical protein
MLGYKTALLQLLFLVYLVVKEVVAFTHYE